MRKLVLILLAFIAVVTFIRAFDNTDRAYSGNIQASSASGIPGGIGTLESVRRP